MDERYLEHCLYCGAEVFYTDSQSMIKCKYCGNTIVITDFQSEQIKYRQAQAEEQRIREALKVAEQEKDEAQDRLNSAVSALQHIQLSQGDSEVQLQTICQTMKADQATTAAMQALLDNLQVKQAEGQDTLTHLLNIIMEKQSTAEQKLSMVQTVSEKILRSQDDMLAMAMLPGEIVTMLQGLQLDAQTLQNTARDFMMWLQSVRAEDVERLKDIRSASDTLLGEQRHLSDQIDSLRDDAHRVQGTLDSFRSEYRADKLRTLTALYQQAEDFQRDLDFEKAADYYRQVITHGAADLEVYWRLILCHYCIEYQQNDAGVYFPVILNPDLTDPGEMSIRKSLLNSPPSAHRDHYIEQLKKIDDILDAYRLNRSRDIFDVYISCSNSNGSNIASRLTSHLKDKGLKVFNAQSQDASGDSASESRVISALMTSKVMIVVGDSPERLSDPNTKREWSRFQWLRRNEGAHGKETDRLLICYLAEDVSQKAIPRALIPNQIIIDGINAVAELDSAVMQCTASTRAASGKTAAFTCAVCGMRLYAPVGAEKYVCEICGFENNVPQRLLIGRMAASNESVVIQYGAEGHSIVWKHPISTCPRGALLNVQEGQEALVFINGIFFRCYEKGQYPLGDDVAAAASDAPGMAVYFVSTSIITGMKWGTNPKVRVQDPGSGMYFEVGASGEFSFRVNDTLKFLKWTSGGHAGSDGEKPDDREELKRYFRSIIMMQSRNALAQTFRDGGISLFEVDERLSEIARAMRRQINSCLAEYGIEMPDYRVSRITTPDDDHAFRRLKRRFDDEALLK